MSSNVITKRMLPLKHLTLLFLLLTFVHQVKYSNVVPLLVNVCNATITVSTTNKTLTNTTNMKYIFSLDEWRALYDTSVSIETTSFCDVPARVQPIADRFCELARYKTCTRLPCHLVQLSSKTPVLIKALSNGRNADSSHLTLGKNSSEIRLVQCIKSPALELFLNGPPYPSLTTEGYTRVSHELLAKTLGQTFRSSTSIWALELNGESITYYPNSGNRTFLSLYDITMGYDRQLYHISGPQYILHNLPYLLNQSRLSFESVMAAKRNVPSYVTAQIFWMNSNCYTPSNRTGYMKELMLHIGVDSWGRCLRNKGPELPPEIAKIQGTSPNVSHYQGKWIEAKKALIKSYPFTIAIENSIHYDYVTEKLWHPLAAGSVPIYYGAPNVDDWLPCKNCIIDLQQFARPSDAAKYIKSIVNNKSRYEEFHQWRKQPVPLKFQRILDYYQRMMPYTLDSVTCAMAHSERPYLTRYEVLSDIGPMF